MFTPAADTHTAPGRSSHFEALQQSFAAHYHDIFLDDFAEKTVVIVPSLTLDKEILRALKGGIYYEERMLCMLMLLRMPRTKVIFVTSVPIDNSIIDYYLHLLPGITGYHARQRLTLLSCYDASPLSLTEKILFRPRLIERIRKEIGNPELAHLSCFNVTEHEKRLAELLNIPLYGCDPSLLYLGTKSGGRRLFKHLGIPVPVGIEGVKDELDIAAALATLKRNNPELNKAVIKMEEGFSGDGNAIFYYNDLDAADPHLDSRILEQLPFYTKVVAVNVSYMHYMNKYCTMGGIVEEFLAGEHKTSPSVQCRINPIGGVDIISTHDQLLGGESGQVFMGATFPADPAYHYDIASMGKTISEELQRLGVLGRFSIDFISVKEPAGWKSYAIEINLRKGGTTHPFIMLLFLTGGSFDWKKGVYTMPNGQTRCYIASDNVVAEKYKGLTPHDLIDIAMCNRLLYDGARQTGVMFHMIGALSQYGKLGMVCIGSTIEEAKDYFYKTLGVLDRECTLMAKQRN